MTSGGNNSNPWAWLGLMKWSLEYTDGTKPTSDAMSAEDRAFLEKVMAEGIIDENERMKTILKEVTAQMESWRTNASDCSREDEDTVEDLLDELRFIVEQIDYARAFQAMGGLSFLLGCVQRIESIPWSRYFYRWDALLQLRDDRHRDHSRELSHTKKRVRSRNP